MGKAGQRLEVQSAEDKLRKLPRIEQSARKQPAGRRLGEMSELAAYVRRRPWADTAMIRASQRWRVASCLALTILKMTSRR